MSKTYKYTSTDGIYEFTLDDDLRGIGSVVDKVVFDRVSKRGYLERRIGKVVFNGTEDWGVSGLIPQTTTIIFQFFLYELAKSESTSLSDKFISLGVDYTQDIESIFFAGTGITRPYIRVNRNRLATQDVAGFKLWLASNNVTLYYELRYPIRTPLTFTKVTTSSNTEVPMTFLTATPSLEYPAEVYDVVSKKVISRGKNLFDLNDVATTANLVIIPDGLRFIDKYAHITYDFKLASRLKPNTTYTFSANMKLISGSLTNSVGSFRLFCDAVRVTMSSIRDTDGYYTTTFTTPSNIKGYTTFYVYSSATIPTTIEITEIQIEEGAVATPYEPYKGTESTLPTLKKIGTVKDSYNPKTGVLTKRISDWLTLDGSSSWGVYQQVANYRGTYRSYTYDASKSGDISHILKYDSKKLTYVKDTDGYQSYGNEHLYLFVNNNDTGFGVVPSVAEWKAYFYGWKMCNADGTSPYYKSEVPYTPATWAEWGKSGSVVSDSTGVSLIDAYPSISMSTTLKNSAKYGILFEVISNTATGNLRLASYMTGTTETISLAGAVGKQKFMFNTQASIPTNSVNINMSSANLGEIKFKDIRIFELPVGSQIETDFNILTADQLVAKYTFNGLCVKNWKHIVGTSQTEIDASKTSVLPTASYTGYTPYKMIYQLATPQEIQMTAEPLPTYYPHTIIETDATYSKPTMDITVKVED